MDVAIAIDPAQDKLATIFRLVVLIRKAHAPTEVHTGGTTSLDSGGVR